MMTRNDFELLARSLKFLYPDRSGVKRPTAHYYDGLEEEAYADGYNAAINQVAVACGQANSRFDADKFKAACGHESEAATSEMPAKGEPIIW